MRFKLWTEEQEAGLNAGTPELMGDPSREAPASNAVKQTGLQPQVDAQPTEPKSRPDQDMVNAIDSNLERLRTDLGEDNPNKGDRVKKFQQMLDSLISQWNAVKMSDGEDAGADGEAQGGLGQTMGDLHYLNMMQQHMNAVPQAPQQNGPGTFGDFGNSIGGM